MFSRSVFGGNARVLLFFSFLAVASLFVPVFGVVDRESHVLGSRVLGEVPMLLFLSYATRRVTHTSCLVRRCVSEMKAEG